MPGSLADIPLSDIPLSDIDLTDPDNFADGFPYPRFATHRREAPVWWHAPTAHTPDGDEGFWSVAGEASDGDSRHGIRRSSDHARTDGPRVGGIGETASAPTRPDSR